jgi:hypothetical protein
VAQRLADAAARVLPASHRARYREEYHSELHDLATVGGSRWRQLVHALRLMGRAWELRAELTAPTAKRVRS